MFNIRQKANTIYTRISASKMGTTSVRANT